MHRVQEWLYFCTLSPHYVHFYLSRCSHEIINCIRILTKKLHNFHVSLKQIPKIIQNYPPSNLNHHHTFPNLVKIQLKHMSTLYIVILNSQMQKHRNTIHTAHIEDVISTLFIILQLSLVYNIP